jgi:hypothetical protein
VSDLPSTLSIPSVSLPRGFVSEILQIGLVTLDYRRAIAGFLRLGIGPWQVYTLGPDNVSDMTYRGRPSTHSMKICLATLGSVDWEIIQPIDGPTIYHDFLAVHGEGVQHIAIRCPPMPWAEKIARLEAHGFRVIQSGSWLGRQRYAYFETEAATGTTLEIFDELPDFVMPEPEEEWPSPKTPGS